MEHSREVYNILDWIGDVGGLFDGTRLIFEGSLSILAFLGFCPMEANLVNNYLED